MAELLRMPEVAAGATTAKLVEWLVAEGKPVSPLEALATIETDKAMVDLTTETGGALLRILVPAGTEVAVGDPVAVIGHAGEDGGAVEALLAAAPSRPPAAATEAAPAAEPAPDVPPRPTEPAGRVFASPIARRLALQAGLDVAALVGSGPGSRIVRRDVEAAIAARPGHAPAPRSAPSSAPAATAAGASGWVDVPHTRLRRAIATRLTASWRDVPHFYVRGSARVSELLALRSRINEALPVKVSLNDLIVKAVAFAHTRVPDANVTWGQDTTRRYDAVDLGVAVSTDGGVVTPVIREVDRLPISAVATASRDLAARARAGRLYQHELEGGTATVSNLGMHGVEEFAAIINPPQSSVLAVGAVRQEAVVGADGHLQAAPVVRLTLGVDHRCIDGAVAGRWMVELLAALEDPIRLLL